MVTTATSSKPQWHCKSPSSQRILCPRQLLSTIVPLPFKQAPIFSPASTSMLNCPAPMLELKDPFTDLIVLSKDVCHQLRHRGWQSHGVGNDKPTSQDSQKIKSSNSSIAMPPNFTVSPLPIPSSYSSSTTQQTDSEVFMNPFIVLPYKVCFHYLLMHYKNSIQINKRSTECSVSRLLVRRLGSLRMLHFGPAPAVWQTRQYLIWKPPPVHREASVWDQFTYLRTHNHQQ